MSKANNFQTYDLKTNGISKKDFKSLDDNEQNDYVLHGSYFKGNNIMTRRDMGNYFAGDVFRNVGISNMGMNSTFGALQNNGNQMGSFSDYVKLGSMSFVNQGSQFFLGSNPLYMEQQQSYDLQNAGYYGY